MAILLAFMGNIIALYLHYKVTKKLTPTKSEYKVGNQRINPKTNKAEILTKKTLNGVIITYHWQDLIHYALSTIPRIKEEESKLDNTNNGKKNKLTR